MLKMKKYVLPTFQNITQIVKKSNFLNDSRRRRMALFCSKKWPELLRRISLKTVCEFYCLNCHLFRTKSKLGSHKNSCENKNFYNVVVQFEDTKVLDIN